MNELYHWGFRRGEQAKSHKYSRRELLGQKKGKNVYRYFYDKVKDFSNKAATKKEEKSEKKDKVGSVLSYLLTNKRLHKAAIKAVRNTSAYKKGKEIVDELIKKDKAKKVAKEEREMKRYKYVAKVELPNGKYRYFYNKDELRAYYENEGTDVDKALMKRFGLKQDSNLPSQDQKVINEHYKNGGINYKMNCYSCTLAYDMRRKGFDAEAIPDPDGLDINSVLDCYKDGRKNAHTNAAPMNKSELTHAMIKDIKKNGDGSHGVLLVKWSILAGWGGHAMAWEVTNGRVQVRDCQSGKTYPEWAIYPSILIHSRSSSESVIWMRTDNLEFDESILKYAKKNQSTESTR